MWASENFKVQGGRGRGGKTRRCAYRVSTSLSCGCAGERYLTLQGEGWRAELAWPNRGGASLWENGVSLLSPIVVSPGPAAELEARL